MQLNSSALIKENIRKISTISVDPVKARIIKGRIDPVCKTDKHL
jgi:hypothetical protein